MDPSAPLGRAQVLAQCFELGPYDQLLKPAYMDKVSQSASLRR